MLWSMGSQRDTMEQLNNNNNKNEKYSSTAVTQGLSSSEQARGATD